MFSCIPDSDIAVVLLSHQTGFQTLSEGEVLEYYGTVGPLIIKSTQAKKGVSKGVLQALDDPFLV